MVKKILISLCGLLLLSTNVFAFSFGLDKPSIYFKTSSLEVLTETIVIYNRSDKPLKIAVSVQDWLYRENRTKKFLNAGESPYSCADWISFEESSFIIEPKKRKNFKFKLRTPNKAEGGHQAVIFFEGSPVKKETEHLELNSSGVEVIGKIGAIIYQETLGETKTTGEITDIALFRQKGVIKAYVKFQNTGDNIIQAKGNIVFINDKKETIARGDISLIKTLPAETAQGVAIIEEFAELNKGNYDVLTTLEYDNKLIIKELTLNVAGDKFKKVAAKPKKIVEKPVIVPAKIVKKEVKKVESTVPAKKDTSSHITKFSIIPAADKNIVKFFIKFKNLVKTAEVYGTILILDPAGAVSQKLSLSKVKAKKGEETLLKTFWKNESGFKKGTYKAKLFIKKGVDLYQEQKTFLIK
jgi:hypothetical protein